MSDRLVMNSGACAMANTEFCASQEDCCLCLHEKDIREKLAEYEQIGAPVSHLRELALLDIDERVVVLPCKVGHTVYMITTLTDTFDGQKYKTVIDVPFRIDLLNSIGIDVFLTRPEATTALAKKG